MSCSRIKSISTKTRLIPLLKPLEATECLVCNALDLPMGIIIFLKMHKWFVNGDITGGISRSMRRLN